MRITLRTEYHTEWGEELFVRLGRKRLPMSFCDGFIWEAVFETTSKTQHLDYSLEVCKQGQILRHEEDARASVALPRNAKNVLIWDFWRDAERIPFHSKLFHDVIFSRTKENAPIPQSGEIYIETFAPCVTSSKVLSISGSSHALGCWTVSKSKGMSHIGDGLWAVSVPIEESLVEFKHIEVDSLEHATWEEGANRKFTANGFDCVMVLGLWLRSPKWKGAGVAVPVFSLRTSKSFGIGEFDDIKLLADFCLASGMKVIQLLPINDTICSRTYRDSYPYSSISSFALNPIYISLSSIFDVAHDACYQKKKEEVDAEDDVDFEKVLHYKEEFLKKAFIQKRESIKQDINYIQFISRNQSWIEPYAAFCTLRDVYKTTDFSKWEKYSQYTPKTTSYVSKKYSENFDFHLFVQYHLHIQLSEAVEYCHRIGIALKGDLPIGVGRHSADVWSNPKQFDCSSSAGAPPDDFSKDGQNWGFPIYNWDEMKKDGYRWWRCRLEKMAEYFDAYRIDHILGFFRIWEVPLDAQSALLGEFFPSLPLSKVEIKKAGFTARLNPSKDYASPNTLWLRYRHSPNGYVPRISPFDEKCFLALSSEQKAAYTKIHDDFFYDRHNSFWANTANERLSALNSGHRMLTCGEDLGMIPGCVPSVMRQKNILSLEIERMPKAMYTEFTDTRSYPYLSVCTTSTHDMSPLREWWEEDYKKSERYFREVLGMHGDVSKNATERICSAIIARHLEAPSMLAIIPIQDWMSINERVRLSNGKSERINIPAVANHYWKYRMHLKIEDILQRKEFLKQVNHLIKKSGR
ncbi:MAG: 4-alpha-glucanotransferase [Alistipes sp.]|nr:4-alpha-glucanotransferase [Candidatus Alistipes equi]